MSSAHTAPKPFVNERYLSDWRSRPWHTLYGRHVKIVARVNMNLSQSALMQCCSAARGSFFFFSGFCHYFKYHGTQGWRRLSGDVQAYADGALG